MINNQVNIYFLIITSIFYFWRIGISYLRKVKVFILWTAWLTRVSSSLILHSRGGECRALPSCCCWPNCHVDPSFFNGQWTCLNQPVAGPSVLCNGHSLSLNCIYFKSCKLLWESFTDTIEKWYMNWINNRAVAWKVPWAQMTLGVFRRALLMQAAH